MRTCSRKCFDENYFKIKRGFWLVPDGVVRPILSSNIKSDLSPLNLPLREAIVSLIFYYLYLFITSSSLRSLLLLCFLQSILFLVQGCWLKLDWWCELSVDSGVISVYIFVCLSLICDSYSCDSCSCDSYSCDSCSCDSCRCDSYRCMVVLPERSYIKM